MSYNSKITPRKKPRQGAPTKKPYHAPVLARLGPVSSLTAGGGQNKNLDTGHNSN